MAILPYGPPGCVREVLGQALSLGCPHLLLGVQEPGMLMTLGWWVLWSKTPTSAAGIAKAPWCTALHKARAGLKLGHEAEDA